MQKCLRTLEMFWLFGADWFIFLLLSCLPFKKEARSTDPSTSRYLAPPKTSNTSLAFVFAGTTSSKRRASACVLPWPPSRLADLQVISGLHNAWMDIDHHCAIWELNLKSGCGKTGCIGRLSEHSTHRSEETATFRGKHLSPEENRTCGMDCFGTLSSFIVAFYQTVASQECQAYKANATPMKRNSAKGWIGRVCSIFAKVLLGQRWSW